jgi:predicted nucleic acid-binding protein
VSVSLYWRMSACRLVPCRIWRAFSTSFSLTESVRFMSDRSRAARAVVVVSERRFFDTNILVYADDASEPEKRKAAVKLLSTHLLADQTAVLSTPVPQEYFAAAMRIGLSAEVAQRHVATYAQANVVQVTTELILCRMHRLHHRSFWDALIVRSARAGGCAVLLSEDL